MNMHVTEQDRAAMARLMQIMNGETPAPSDHRSQVHVEPVLTAPGTVTTQEVQAMADVLRRLDEAVNRTHDQMISERHMDPHLQEALITESVPGGVKIGVYEILQHQDNTRVAGHQYYSVINKHTQETLAHELSLYEAAHGLVKLLNRGEFINSSAVRALLEAESVYTGQKIDAVHHHRHMRAAERRGDSTKAQLMESRKQASMDRAMKAKHQLRKLYNQL
jgi:hypothetical protein